MFLTHTRTHTHTHTHALSLSFSILLFLLISLALPPSDVMWCDFLSVSSSDSRVDLFMDYFWSHTHTRTHTLHPLISRGPYTHTNHPKIICFPTGWHSFCTNCPKLNLNYVPTGTNTSLLHFSRCFTYLYFYLFLFWLCDFCVSSRWWSWWQL